jgi:hypothetical protein
MNSKARTLWSRILTVVGSIGMLVGAVDPLEGSLLILPGSGLVALGTWLGHSERPVLIFRALVFVLIAIGVGAMFALSNAGGIGGSSGRSLWWGLLILPYLVGWCMGVWGPDSPRWVLLLGIVVGLWYLTLTGLVLNGPARPFRTFTCTVISTVGLVTIAGCLLRLRMRVTSKEA